jgi:hypothetical protein
MDVSGHSKVANQTATSSNQNYDRTKKDSGSIAGVPFKLVSLAVMQ